MILCITGGIACGKSETGRILAENRFVILDTDRVAHELMEPGRPVYTAVVRCFGREIVRADGTLDRRKLGGIVFADAGKRRRLESLTHPAVVERCREWIAALRVDGRDGAVLIPLYFEAGIVLDVDAVICLSSAEETMLSRLEERGLDRDAARSRIAAQMPLAEKARRSDHTVTNDASLEELERTVVQLVERLRVSGDSRA